MWKRAVVVIGAAAAAATIYGCSKQPQTQAATDEDKVFPLTPASVEVRSGVVTGELKDLKVTETVEKGSGEVVSPPTLSGTLDLKNGSKDEAVRLVSGDIEYVGPGGKQIKLGKDRTAPVLSFSSYSDGSTLDPGKETSQSLDVDFPSRTLKAKDLKDIRVDVAYTELPYKAQTLNFATALGRK